MIRRISAIAVKELLQFRRDWRTALALLAMPVVLLLIYGFALSFDVTEIRLGIVDQSRSQASRQLVQAFLKSGYFVQAAVLDDPRPLDALFAAETVQAALIIPPDLAANAAARRPVSVQFVLDGSDAQTANTVLGYARQIVAAQTGAVFKVSSSAPYEVRPLVWYNPDLKSTIFLVPGLLAFILMMTSVIATALAVVREKERGTMESLRATPVRAIELLLGKALPYLLVASISAAGSLFLAWAQFEVPIRGSLLWLAAITLLFLAGGLGWGIFISTIADNQQLAFQLSLLSSMLPTLLLSGFIFPLTSMPRILQFLSHLFPARYYVSALRSVVLKGVGPEVWWGEATALVIFALVILTLATARMVRSL
jgi:ABC-2 type transport system permease protein